MLLWGWASVVDVGSALYQHWIDVPLKVQIQVMNIFFNPFSPGTDFRRQNLKRKRKELTKTFIEKTIFILHRLGKNISAL